MAKAGRKFPLKTVGIVTGAVVVVIALLAVFGWWRIGQGPVSLGFISGQLESIVNKRLGGISIKIRDAVLERDDQSGRIQFRLRGLQLIDDQGKILARAPRASLGVKGNDLLSGNVVPTRLTLIGPNVILHQRGNSGIQLGIGAADDESGGSTAPGLPASETTAQPATKNNLGRQSADPTTQELIKFVLKAVAEKPGEGGDYSSFEDISIRDATITLNDYTNNTVWFAPRANLVFQRVASGLTALMDAEISAGQHPVKLQLAANYKEEDGTIRIKADLADIVPAEIAHKLPWLSNLADVRLPLRSSVFMELGRDGGMRHAEARLSAGAGFVSLPGVLPKPLLVDEGDLGLVYSPDTGNFRITQSSVFIGRSKAALTGLITPSYDKTGRLRTVKFNLTSDNVDVATKSEPSANDVVRIDKIALAGIADVQSERVDIDAFSLKAGKAEVYVAGSVVGYGGIPAVKLTGKLANMPFVLIKDLWPPAAAKGAREWLVENIISGTASSGTLKVNITADGLKRALNGAPLPNEQLSFKFNLRDVSTRYLGDLPYIRQARGQGHVQGNKFLLTMSKGSVRLKSGARIALTKGRFFVGNLAKPGTIGELSVLANGASASIAQVLDHKPLGYMTKFGIKPASIGGDTALDVRLRLPMLKELPLDAVTIRTFAKLRKLRLKRAIGDVDITGGGIDLDVKGSGLTGNGIIRLNDVPAKLKWVENFDKSVGDTTRFNLEATLDDKTRRKFGIDLSDIVRGTSKISVSARGVGPDIKIARIKSDLSKAQLFFKPLGWRKASGGRTTASFDVHFPANGDFVFKKLNVKGPDLTVSGEVTLDKAGKIKQVDLPVLRLGKINTASLTGKRGKDNSLAVSFRGRTIDGRPIMRALFKDKPGGRPVKGPRRPAPMLAVDAQIDRLIAHDGEVLGKVRSKIETRDGRLVSLKLASQFRDQSPMTVNGATARDGSRRIVIRSPNGGAVLRAAGVYGKIVKGQLKLVVNMPERKAAKVNGVLNIRDFSIRGEPALASLASDERLRSGIDTGDTSAAARRRSASVAFRRLRVPYTVEGNNLVLQNSYIRGPAIGASARGTINTSTEAIAIRGTLIPAYAVNSFLGNVPIVGQVLTGGKGQGVFGVTFRVGGKLSRPKFSVNPISALAPGILRRLFDLPGGDIGSSGNQRKINRFDELNTQ